VAHSRHRRWRSGPAADSGAHRSTLSRRGEWHGADADLGVALHRQGYGARFRSRALRRWQCVGDSLRPARCGRECRGLHCARQCHCAGPQGWPHGRDLRRHVCRQASGDPAGHCGACGFRSARQRAWRCGRRTRRTEARTHRRLDSLPLAAVFQRAGFHQHQRSFQDVGTETLAGRKRWPRQWQAVAGSSRLAARCARWTVHTGRQRAGGRARRHRQLQW
jgi:hypothetical protein